MKELKAFGTKIVEPLGPNQLKGKNVSLNFKNCKWFLPPSQDYRISLNMEHPTALVPDDISAEDLMCVFNKIKAGHIVLGTKPVEEFTKQADVLEKHLNMIRQNFPETTVKEYIEQVARGPNLDGGYTKLEIFEKMLEQEEKNPITGKGGRNRPGVITHLKEALEYCTSFYGGHSAVREEVAGDSSGRELPSASITPERARQILNL